MIRAPVLVLLLLLAAGPGHAAEQLAVGKAAANSFSFVPLDVGIEEGFFTKQGLDVQELGLAGSAKLAQAMAADSLDIALGAGTDLIFAVKGSPEKAVADMAGPPLVLSFIVPWDSAARSADDLKGKRFGISTVNSLTQWLSLQLAQEKGWGPNGISFVTVGSDAASQTAPLVSGQIDVVVASTGLGLQLAAEHRGRNLFPVSDVVKTFMTHAIFASDKVMRERPDAVRKFLKGWFETIAFMRTHKDATVAITEKVTGYSPSVAGETYDIVMPMFSLDGRFDPKAMAVIAQSFVDLHMTAKEPDLSKYVTDAYLPAAPGE